MLLTLRTTHSVPRRGRSITGLWRAVRGALKRMERNAAMRREFERMDDRMLSDIGVSRAQLGFELDDRPHPRR